MYKINELPTPCFVIDEGKLEENLKLLHQVEERTGAKILLAQKCFFLLFGISADWKIYQRNNCQRTL